MIETQEQLLKKINVIESLIRGPKFFRLFIFFFKYCRIALSRLFHNINSDYSKAVVSSTFFSRPMSLMLPGSADLFLFGMKAHHSEIRLAKFLIRHVNDKDVVIDCGAHFGYYSKLFSELVGVQGHVYSIEASKFCYDVLRQNTRSYQNISCFHQALGSDNEAKLFFEFPAKYSEYSASSIEQYNQSDWISEVKIKQSIVAYESLDSFLSRNEVIPSFIKIDVEGSELEVIQGLESVLLNKSPIIIMEFVNDGRPNEKYFRAAVILIAKGFYPKAIDKDGYLHEIKDIREYFEINSIDSDNIVFDKA